MSTSPTTTPVSAATPPDQVASEAIQAFHNADSYRVQGIGPVGDPTETISLSIEGHDNSVGWTAETESIVGVITYADDGINVDAKVIQINHRAYVNEQQTGGKWFEEPAGFATEGWLAVLQPDTIVAHIQDDPLKNMGLRTINGITGIEIVGSRYTTLVAATGTPFPLYVSLNNGGPDYTYTVSFDDYNQPVNATTPPDAVTSMAPLPAQ